MYLQRHLQCNLGDGYVLLLVGARRVVLQVVRVVGLLLAPRLTELVNRKLGFRIGNDIYSGSCHTADEEATNYRQFFSLKKREIDMHSVYEKKRCTQPAKTQN